MYSFVRYFCQYKISGSQLQCFVSQNQADGQKKYSPDHHVTTLNYTKQYLKERWTLSLILLVEKYVNSYGIHLIQIVTKIGQVFQKFNQSGASEIQSVRRFRNSIGQVFQKFNWSGVSEIQSVRYFGNPIGQVFQKFNRSGVSEIQSVGR
jgi:hypothetical protein